MSVFMKEISQPQTPPPPPLKSEEKMRKVLDTIDFRVNYMYTTYALGFKFDFLEKKLWSGTALNSSPDLSRLPRHKTLQDRIPDKFGDIILTVWRRHLALYCTILSSIILGLGAFSIQSLNGCMLSTVYKDAAETTKPQHVDGGV